MIDKQKQNGFTLVELSLAMVFIAFMLVFLVTTILHATRLYTKGLAIRQINQAGRQVVDSVSKNIRYSEPIYLQDNNRLCTGQMTYVWNLEGENINTYTTADSGQLRLVSVDDPGQILCKSDGAGLPAVDIAKAQDLIGGEVSPLLISIDAKGQMQTIRVVFSTSGSNLATNVGTAEKPKFECNPNNQFCAFGEFETSVYSRRF